MANFGNRVNRLGSGDGGKFSVGDIDAELDALVRFAPCLPSHRAPEGLSEEKHLVWINNLLENHRVNGPCESRQDREER